MEKLVDWESRLIAYLRSVSKKPFKYGEHDCFIFTLQAVEAQTGVDLYTDVIGKYDDSESALKFCKEHGYKSHVDAISKNFKPRESLLQAMRGDIIAVRSLENQPALGICQGSVVYAIGETGLYSLPMEYARKAFAV